MSRARGAARRRVPVGAVRPRNPFRDPSIIFPFEKAEMMSKLKVLSVMGTRPEGIKMAPIIRRLKEFPERVESKVCVTGQHRELLDQVLEVFRIHPDYDLNLMGAHQDLFDTTVKVLTGMKTLLKDERPDLVLVQGDTTTTMAAALAAYYFQLRLGHVEAGLRTGYKHAPFPEEVNRVIAGAVADIHFAPTEIAYKNLVRSGVDSSKVLISGNTVVDALLEVSARINADRELRTSLDQQFTFLDSARQLILVTGHRRESFGKGFENICSALLAIAREHPSVQLCYPVHLNPRVQEPVYSILGSAKRRNIHLIEPLGYVSFVYLMMRSHFILTDSGGVQEEAITLRKPVLVMRDVTERPEGIEVGAARLVGRSVESIVAGASALLKEETLYRQMTSANNPYGDGKAAVRIVDKILTLQDVGGENLPPSR